MSARLIEQLAALPPGMAARVLKGVRDENVLEANRDFSNWTHDGQDEPPGDWSCWVVQGGRGFGKTRIGSEWVAAAARAPSTGSDPLRIALVAATLDEARRIMIEGESGLLAVAGEEITAWLPSLKTLRFAGGAEAVLFSGASPEGLRGPQHHIAWCDELAKWGRGPESWDMLRLGLRLGEHPRVLVTTTPRPGHLLEAIKRLPGTVTTGGPTRANIHLPGVFVSDMHAAYAGTRLERQELLGELLPDARGALWTVELIERCRSTEAAPPPLACGESTTPASGRREFARTVIGVDPPSGDGTCGIVACALDANGIAQVLADHSVSGRTPEGWARAVADAARIHAADKVVAERNQGGKMVEFVLRAADARLSLKLVNARENKSARADPVALLFEAGKVRLAGVFPELEAELRGLIAGGGYEGPGPSPDRADAMVWALTELMLAAPAVEPRLTVF